MMTKTAVLLLSLIFILSVGVNAEKYSALGGLPSSFYNDRLNAPNSFFSFLSIGTGACESTTSYYTYIPGGSEYAGATAPCSGITIDANAVYVQKSGWVGSLVSKVKQCADSEIAVVGSEAKGQNWGNTVACSSGWYCADQRRMFDAWGCTPGAIEYSYQACSNTCNEHGYPTACNPDSTRTSAGCVVTSFTFGESGYSTFEEWYNNPAVDPFRGLVCANSIGFPYPKYKICKYAGATCPSEKTISYGCKPNPDWRPPSACTGYVPYCSGNDLRQKDAGCNQDLLIKTCDFGCNSLTSACNVQSIPTLCSWNGKKCIGNDLYQTDTVCNKQELFYKCVVGCVTDHCIATPVLTPTPFQPGLTNSAPNTPPHTGFLGQVWAFLVGLWESLISGGWFGPIGR